MPRRLVHSAMVGSAVVFLAFMASSARGLTPPAEGLACSYSGADRTVTFTIGMGEDEGVRVQRLGDEIAMYSDFIAFTPRRGKKPARHRRIVTPPTPCNTVPTVQNTDSIRVVVAADENLTFDISLEGGPFAPGATPESDGTSEIEIAVEGLKPGQRVRFAGGSEADWFRFGSHHGTRGVNLNAQDEPDLPDIDATMALDQSLPADLNSHGEWPPASARTGQGDDKITTVGGPEFGETFGGGFEANGGPGNDTLIGIDPQFTFFKGASGNDILQGGPFFNLIYGGGGTDVILGGKGEDDVEPGNGRDLAFVDGGHDIVVAADGVKDRISCGPGRDIVSRDPKDRIPGCERRTTEKFHLKFFDH